jgi:hypothetical protein
MASDAEPSGDEQAVIEQAERMLAGQAAITRDEASNRVRLYARFRDLRLVDVCQAILEDTLRLLTIQESDKLARRTAASDPPTSPR